eukprot:scaffold1403_cov180-Ochromonas_danica.AAC.21
MLQTTSSLSSSMSTSLNPAPLIVKNTSSSSAERLRSNSYEVSKTKRIRAGSISCRLRAASDLEESGFIDKHQKGLIKDLIISGDATLQTLLDKYERGDRQELLDFDFLNNFPISEEDEEGMDFLNGMGLVPQQSSISSMPPPTSGGVGSSSIISLNHSSNAPSSSMTSMHHHHHLSVPSINNGHDNATTMERHRRESIDNLYVQELLPDDLDHHLPHYLPSSSTQNHFPHSSHMADSNVFNELFHHFATSEENGGAEMMTAGSVSSSGKSQRKSIRLDNNNNNNNNNGSTSDRVDLSAYATLAASLEAEGRRGPVVGSSLGGLSSGITSSVGGGVNTGGIRSLGTVGGSSNARSIVTPGLGSTIVPSSSNRPGR